VPAHTAFRHAQSRSNMARHPWTFWYGGRRFPQSIQTAGSSFAGFMRHFADLSEPDEMALHVEYST